MNLKFLLPVFLPGILEFLLFNRLIFSWLKKFMDFVFYLFYTIDIGLMFFDLFQERKKPFIFY